MDILKHRAKLASKTPEFTGTAVENIEEMLNFSSGDVVFFALYEQTDGTFYSKHDIYPDEACHALITEENWAFEGCEYLVNSHYLTDYMRVEHPHTEIIQRWLYESSPWSNMFANPSWQHVLQYGFWIPGEFPANYVGHATMATKQIRERQGGPRGTWKRALEYGFNEQEAFILGGFMYDIPGIGFQMYPTSTQTPFIQSRVDHHNSRVGDTSTFHAPNMSLWLDPEFKIEMLAPSGTPFNNEGYYYDSRMNQDVGSHRYRNNRLSVSFHAKVDPSVAVGKGLLGHMFKPVTHQPARRTDLTQCVDEKRLMTDILEVLRNDPCFLTLNKKGT